MLIDVFNEWFSEVIVVICFKLVLFVNVWIKIWVEGIIVFKFKLYKVVIVFIMGVESENIVNIVKV